MSKFAKALEDHISMSSLKSRKITAKGRPLGLVKLDFEKL